jgi:hypothetical protein
VILELSDVYRSSICIRSPISPGFPRGRDPADLSSKQTVRHRMSALERATGKVLPRFAVTELDAGLPWQA